MRCVQSPTSWGCDEVHALGSIVSSAHAKPWTTLNPDTLAVIDPSVDAASAVVERWPMAITEAIEREYSNKFVLVSMRWGQRRHDGGYDTEEGGARRSKKSGKTGSLNSTSPQLRSVQDETVDAWLLLRAA